MNTNILNILKQINISKILGGTSKTLNIIKKSIPVYKEIRPYVRKEKTFFKKDDLNENIDIIKESKPLRTKEPSSYNDSLTFFN